MFDRPATYNTVVEGVVDEHKSFARWDVSYRLPMCAFVLRYVHSLLHRIVVRHHLVSLYVSRGRASTKLSLGAHCCVLEIENAVREILEIGRRRYSIDNHNSEGCH